MPDVFSYDDHRKFMADAFDELRKTRKRFSLRWLAGRAGFASHTYLPKVISGDRSLTPESVARVAQVLGLRGASERYFKLLAAWNDTPPGPARDQIQASLEGAKLVGRRRKLDLQQARYYEKWYYPVVRHLVVWAPWNGDWAKLGGMLDPSISANQAQEAVETLLELGLLDRDGDKFRTSAPNVNVDRLPVVVKQRGRHDILRLGVESLLRHSPEERHTHCLLLAMSRRSYGEAVEILTEAGQRCLGLAASDPVVDRVWQVAIQVFPTSADFGGHP